MVIGPSEPALWEWRNNCNGSRSAAQKSQLLPKSPADLCCHLCSSTIWMSYKVNVATSWIHLPNCRCFQVHVTMVLHHLRAHSWVPGGTGIIWKYLRELVRLTRVSGGIAYGFWTVSHFSDRWFQAPLKPKSATSDAATVFPNTTECTARCEGTLERLWDLAYRMLWIWSSRYNCVG